MSQPTSNKSERLALRNAYMLELIQASIRRRWGVNDWDIRFPWWRPPATVRILMYADGRVQFADGPFLGLQHVITLLKSRPYFYVAFDIATAHREGDPTATIKAPTQLTDLVLDDFDEIWFFGFSSVPTLTRAEVTALDSFMAAPKCGGVLVTGDHADLGKGIAGLIPRAGKMRLYPAPPDQRPVWYTTVEDGPDPGGTFDAADQEDDRPQTITYERFPVWSSFGGEPRFRPHPVLCGPNGPIDVFPDHQHEGEALAPTFEPFDTEWPTKNGHQERPVVIARGRIKDPEATHSGKEIGLLSAYNGHEVDVGRIVADSTWHHWFDINLLGTESPPSPYAGFDATPAGQAALKKIEAFFLNCGAWLAPPDKQAEMRNVAWWSILWTDQIVELSADAPIWHLGQEAISALGRRASSCAVTEWVFGSPTSGGVIPCTELTKVFKHPHLFNLPFEQYVAGGILRQLMLQVGPSDPARPFPFEVPPDEELGRAIDDGVREGIDALKVQLKSDAKSVLKLVADDFRL